MEARQIFDAVSVSDVDTLGAFRQHIKKRVKSWILTVL